MLTLNDQRTLDHAESLWLAPPRDEEPDTEAYIDEMERRAEDEWVTRYLTSQPSLSGCML